MPTWIGVAGFCPTAAGFGMHAVVCQPVLWGSQNSVAKEPTFKPI